MKYIAIALVLLGAGHALAGPHDWTQWRGPDQSGKTEVTNLPVTWSDEENIAWKTALPGAGSSQPVTRDGRIYVSSWSGYDPGGLEHKETRKVEGLKYQVTCLDAENGEILWTTDLEPLNEMAQSSRNVRHHGFATPTPLLDDKNRLFVSFGTGGLFALDLDGEVHWKRSIGDKLAGWGYAASLADLGETLVVNASVEGGELLAIDKMTGDTLWSNGAGMDWEKVQHNFYDRSWTTPLVWTVNDKPRIAILVVGQHLHVYDPENGEILWKVNRVGGGYACNTPMPSADGKILYCMAGSSHGITSSSAIKAEDDVEGDRVIWKHEARGAALVPPILFQGRLHYAAYGAVKPNTIQGIGALDPATGEVIYHQEPEGLERNTLVYASPIIGEGRMYVQTQEQGCFVLDATTTEYTVLAHNLLTEEKSALEMKSKSGNGFNATPVPLPNGRLLLRSYWGVHCIEAQQ